MEIVLIRHGKPTGAIYPRVTASGFADWVRKYDQSGIVEGDQPEANVMDKYQAYYIVSSDFKRAVESVHLCFNKSPSQEYSLFRELEVPRYKLPFKLKVSTWLVLNRLLWVLGFKGTSESHSSAKKRVSVACEQLIELANKHDKIVLVSHGYINFYIRRALSKKGWILKEKSQQYWGVTRFETIQTTRAEQ